MSPLYNVPQPSEMKKEPGMIQSSLETVCEVGGTLANQSCGRHYWSDPPPSRMIGSSGYPSSRSSSPSVELCSEFTKLGMLKWARRTVSLSVLFPATELSCRPKVSSSVLLALFWSLMHSAALRSPPSPAHGPLKPPCSSSLM